MFLLRILQIIFILIILASSAFAQNRFDSVSQISKLNIQLEQIANDAEKLKLPENKALVYARLGSICWKFDKSRARQLFNKSIDKLITAQNEVELKEENRVRRNDLLIYGKTRQSILENIVYKDAGLAFELFLKSRSKTVNEAFAGISNEPPYNTYNGMLSNELIVQQENMLKQRLTEIVADQNPDRAVDILSNLLRKKLTTQSLTLIKKIHQKDAATADAFTREILQKILTADFKKDSTEFQLAVQFLFEAAREGSENLININSKTLNDLAEKVATFLIKEADRNAQYSVSYIKPILIKLLPERVDEIDQKIVLPRRRSFELTFPQNKEATELLQSDATAEELLEKANKFPPSFREQIYVKAVEKIALDGNTERAKEILTKNFTAQRLDKMFASLNWVLVYRALEKGDLERAEDLIAKLPKDLRFEALINLAQSLSKKNPNHRQKAVQVLGQARSLIPGSPTDLSEVHKIAQLAAAYAYFESEIGFNLFNNVIKKLVYVSEADAVVKDFRGNSNVRNGEFLINSGFRFSGFSEIESSLSKLAKIDVEKTLDVINKIKRRDIRIALQLQTLENNSEF